MKALSPALQGHLDGGTTTLAWCWRVVRTDGVVLGFTDHDRALAFDGTAFEPEAGFTATEIRAGSDLAVDAQEAEGVLRSDRIAEADILAGLWDGAEVEVWRVNWSDPGQRVLMRQGAIGEVRRGRVAFVAEVRSLAHVLNQPVGRLYQSVCDADLGDARCGVDLSDPAFRGTGTVSSLRTERSFVAGGLGGFAPGWFDRGQLLWTSGGNAGRAVGIAGHAAGAVLTLAEAPVAPLAPGDAFEVTAGCDKRLASCAGKFANVLNFRGFPHIPGQDAVLRYASDDGTHQGDVL